MKVPVDENVYGDGQGNASNTLLLFKVPTEPTVLSVALDLKCVLHAHME